MFLFQKLSLSSAAEQMKPMTKTFKPSSSSGVEGLGGESFMSDKEALWPFGIKRHCAKSLEKTVMQWVKLM